MKKMLTCGAAAAALVGGPALAQPATTSATTADERSSRIEEVVVTARRREENLQSVPVAVSVTTGAEIEARNIVKVEDLQRTTAGMTVVSATRGGSTPAYAIRGQRTYDTSSSSDPAITLYFDEYGVTRTTGSNQLLFDLASVQVLKGPQGTLFGRNNTGGAILVTPNTPQFEAGGYVKGTLGSYDLRDIEGVVNVPLGHMAALRLSGKYTARDGYLRNVLSDEKLDDIDSIGLRGALLIRPNDSIESTTTALYYKNDSNGTAAKLVAIQPARSPAPAVYTPLLNAELAATNALGRYQFRSSIRDFKSVDEVWGVQNKTTIELGENLTIKNIIGNRDISTKASIDTDGSGLVLIDYFVDVKTKQFSEELQVQSNLGPLELVSGLFYFKETSTDKNEQFQFTDLIPPGRPLAAGLQDYEVSATSYAAFAHVNYDASSLLEGLSLSAGLRYTHDKRKVTPRTRTPIYNAATNSYAYQCVLTGVVHATSDRNLCGAEGSASFNEPTWNASINYQLDGDTLVYVAHRHGYKAGGINSRATPTTGFRPYDPEKVNDIELGLKKDFQVGDLSGRFNAAVYRTWLSQAQKTQVTTVTVAGTTFVSNLVSNAARATVNGLEAELVLRPTDALTFNLGYSLIDAQYSSWFDSIVIGGVITPVDISDSRFAYIPKHQLNASVRYELPVSDDIGQIALLGTAYFQSAVYDTDINSRNCGPGGAYLNCLNADSRLDGYGLIGLRAEWKKPFGAPIEVAAFVENLTKTYYENFGFTALANGFRSVGIGAPRTFGISVRAAFGGLAD
jgi:iron complex outermembrane receptor protein